MNAWHDVDLGDETPEYFRAVIEIPIGSRVKYELDKPTGLLEGRSRLVQCGPLSCELRLFAAHVLR